MKGSRNRHIAILVFFFGGQSMEWNEMEYGMNGSFGVKYGKCQNGMKRFQESNGKQSSILPYQFHTKFLS